ncbi:transcriptional regulator swi6 [Nowakowskiella sp. JEL0407]|nr:transcriptional regulator swi6 [Nowakowskiella sp. JEL0407]
MSELAGKLKAKSLIEPLLTSDEQNERNLMAQSGNLQDLNTTTPQDVQTLLKLTEVESTILKMILCDDYLPSYFTTNDSSSVDLNLIMDQIGNGAIHWAARSAKTRVLRLLLAKGAYARLPKFSGQTALITAVREPNGYICLNFNETVNLLSPILLYVDEHGRTLLHHIALTTDNAASIDSAMYYTTVVLNFVGNDYQDGCFSKQRHQYFCKVTDV